AAKISQGHEIEQGLPGCRPRVMEKKSASANQETRCARLLSLTRRQGIRNRNLRRYSIWRHDLCRTRNLFGPEYIREIVPVQWNNSARRRNCTTLLAKEAHRPRQPMRHRVSLLLLLEDQLQSELYLARRTRVPGRESGGADNAKRCAADLRNAAGLAEICVVKQVENLSPELHLYVLFYFGCLQDREIGVGESRANNNVAAQIPEVKDVPGR